MNPLLLSAGLKLLTNNDTVRSTAKDTAFSAAQTVAAIGAGIATRKLVTTVWTKATGNQPPNDPSDPSVDWMEAVSWAASAGVAVGVGRVVGRRVAADVWARNADDDRGAELGGATS